jgi:hypothetical protein
MNADNILMRPHFLNELMGIERGTELTESMAASLAKLRDKIKDGGELTANQQKDFDNWTYREKNGPELSTTCKKRLVKIYREITTNRYYSHSNKYTEKGIRQENDGITLYSLVKGNYYKKNTTRRQSEYFDGEWDLLDTDENQTIDIKCPWGLDTLPHPASHLITPEYEDQGYGYVDIARHNGYKNVNKHTIAYCLVNAPGDLIHKEKMKVYYEWGMPEDHSDDWVQMKRQIERNMIFDMDQFRRDNPFFDLDTPLNEWNHDLPRNERVVEYVVNVDENRMTEIKNRILLCRKWMNDNLFKVELKQLKAA